MDKREETEGTHGQRRFTNVKDILKRVFKKYKNVEMGIECSAYYNQNVKSVLNCAQRAVLYPLSPLYALEQHTITPNFRKALIRIFRVLNPEMNGSLHDSELNKFHEEVFQS
jgi:Holliday junction resolvasome RuvABC endonuclease subunit